MKHSYLKKRGDIYAVRIYIPSCFSHHFHGKTEIVRSLHTRYIREAKARAHPILYASSQLFTLLRANVLSESEIDRAIEKYKEEHLDTYRKQRDRGAELPEIVRDAFQGKGGGFPSLDYLQQDFLLRARQFHPDRTMEDIEALIDQNEGGIALRKKLIAIGRLDQDIRSEAYHLAKSRGIDVELPSMDYLNPNEDAYFEPPPSNFTYFARELMRAQIEILKIENERLRGNEPEYDKERKKRELSSKTLSEVYDLRIKEAQQKARAAKTITRINQTSRLLCRILGDKDIRDYNLDEILEAAKTLSKWPRNANSRPDLAHLSTIDILKRKDLGAPIATSTLNGYKTELNTIFNYAVAKGFIDRSPCPNWEIDKTKGKSEQDRHLPWSREEILSLLSTRPFTAPQFRVKKNQENYWLPLLALFTGCRQNELCQLYCDDLILDPKSDIWYFRITQNDSRNQRTKNPTSERNIPIHKSLISLGILSYRDRMTAKGDRLFPDLVFHAGEGNYSRAYSKRFNRHVERNVNFPDGERKKVFHGFRASFVQALRDYNGVSEESIGYLTGHSPQNKMVAHYGGQPALCVLSEHIEKLDYGIDFLKILGTFPPTP